MGVHGASVAFLRWKEGGKRMAGVRHHAGNAGAATWGMSGSSSNLTIRASAARRFWRQGFALQDEFFAPGHVFAPCTRVLLGIDVERTDLSSEPRDGAYRTTKTMRWRGCGSMGAGVFSMRGSVITRRSLSTRSCWSFSWRQVGWATCPRRPCRAAAHTGALRAQEKLGLRLGMRPTPFTSLLFRND